MRADPPTPGVLVAVALAVTLLGGVLSSAGVQGAGVGAAPAAPPVPDLPFSDEPAQPSPSAAPPARITREQARRAAQVLRRQAAARARPPAPRPAGESLAARRTRLLAQLPYPWQALGWTVSFAGPVRGTQGLANPRARTITVFVRPSQSDAELLRVLAHEVGHAVDLTYGSPARRSEWRRLRGIPTSTSWFPCDACTDYSSGAGDFAEAFAVYLVGPREFRSRLGAVPDADELFDLGHLLWP